MEEEEEVSEVPVLPPAGEVEHEESQKVAEPEPRPAGAQRHWLSQVLEPVVALLRDARDGPPDYRVFLMAMAVIAFCMFALWIQTP